MERVNIYINENQKNDLEFFSKTSKISMAKTVRLAVDEFREKYNGKIQQFVNTLNELNPKDKILREKDEQFVEKCRNDIVFFIENAIKISNLNFTLIPFKLTKEQKNIINNYKNHNKLIINKCRQCGFTKVLCAIICHFILFNKNKNVLLVTCKMMQGYEILDNIKLMLKALPNILIPNIDTNTNKNKLLKLDTNSSVTITTINNSHFVGHGISYDLMCIDECSYIKYDELEEFFNRVMPTVINNTGKIIIGSSSIIYKRKNKFCELWFDSILERNDFHPVVIPWNTVPNRDLTWASKQRKILGEKNFLMEYECKFIKEDMNGENDFYAF